MGSPFPGMDPYLEDPAFWPDFHARFIGFWADLLSDLLPESYEARIDERINLVEHPPEKIKSIQPDVFASRRGPAARVPAAVAGVAHVGPVTIPMALGEETRETYIQILHRPERSLVSVLELLSPANKVDPGRGVYLAKRAAILQQSVHLVELDLLVGGRRLPLQKDYPPGDYFALIARGNNRPYSQVYAWTLRHSLLIIPVPLKAPDPDLLIDLGKVFATTYDRGRYARSLAYDQPLPMALDDDESAWIQEQLKKG